MAQDPAFLFYYQDFLVGTTFMNYEERGAYITLLCFQAAKGSLSEADILKKIPSHIWQAICGKFVCKDGRYLNERLAKEITKRQLYCQNRRDNLHMGKHMAKHMKGAMTAHMENENENNNYKNNVNINNDSILNNVNVNSNNIIKRFPEFWRSYPKPIGEAIALMTFRATVKTEQDFKDLMIALNNYKASEEYKKGFIKNGNTWIEDWRGWLAMPPKKESALSKYEVKR